MTYTGDMNKGESLSKLLRAHGVNFSHLCREVDYYKKGKGISRNAIYDWLSDEKLASDKVLAITKALMHLPTRHQGLTAEIESIFTDLRIGEVVLEEEEKFGLNDIDQRAAKQIEHWRSKYIATLERLNTTIERLNSIQQELILERSK